MINALALWLAQGFGVGRIPVAPGTFGSIVGLGWVALLLCASNFWLYLAGSLVGLGLSVFCCERAEVLLEKKDPSSVVLDEIAAMPVCFAAWIVLFCSRQHAWPSAADLFNREAWLWSLGIFLAFRFFDVIKPWPVHQSQKLPGGWGVTADDLLAALYVNVCTLAVFFWLEARGR
jgi:phosphatidylglycerophosphatase A